MLAYFVTVMFDIQCDRGGPHVQVCQAVWTSLPLVSFLSPQDPPSLHVWFWWAVLANHSPYLLKPFILTLKSRPFQRRWGLVEILEWQLLANLLDIVAFSDQGINNPNYWLTMNRMSQGNFVFFPLSPFIFPFPSCLGVCPTGYHDACICSSVDWLSAYL